MDVVWDITSRCNLSCIHCYNSRLYAPDGIAVADDLPANKVKELILQMRDLPVGVIQFLGGEPFLFSDFLEILRFASEQGVLCNVATNGIPINATKAATIAELGVRQVAFSIDGATAISNDCIRGNGTFDRATSNLAETARQFRLRGSKTRLGIHCTLNRLNIPEIPDIINLAERLGVHFVSFDSLKIIKPQETRSHGLNDLAPGLKQTLKAMDAIGSAMARKPGIRISILNFGSPKLRQYISTKHGIDLQVQRSCTAASEMIYVRADGYVYPCNYSSDFPGKLLPETLREQARNVWNVPLIDIVDSNYFKSFYNFAHSGRTYERLDYCKSCSLYDVCEPCPLDVVRWGESVCKDCMNFDRLFKDRQCHENPGESQKESYA